MFPWVGGDRRVVLAVVGCGTAVILALIGAVTFLSSRHVPTADLMALVGVVVSPVIGVVLYGQIANVRATVASVERQVNGNASKAQETIQLLATGQVAAPTSPVGVTGTPET